MTYVCMYVCVYVCMYNLELRNYCRDFDIVQPVFFFSGLISMEL